MRTELKDSYRGAFSSVDRGGGLLAQLATADLSAILTVANLAKRQLQEGFQLNWQQQIRIDQIRGAFSSVDNSYNCHVASVTITSGHTLEFVTHLWYVTHLWCVTHVWCATHLWYVTHTWYVSHITVICVTCHMCVTYHRCVAHHTCVTYMWHICDIMTWHRWHHSHIYGVATIRRLLKIIGLFCKRLLRIIGLFCKRIVATPYMTSLTVTSDHTFEFVTLWILFFSICVWPQPHPYGFFLDFFSKAKVWPRQKLCQDWKHDGWLWGGYD